MPIRLDPLITGEYYHVFNKTIDGKIIFTNKHFSQLFLNLLHYYRSSVKSVSYSRFIRLDDKMKREIMSARMHAKYYQARIFAYCLMPNHFHLLMRQTQDGGVSKYLADIANAFTRFYNVTHKRKGPLFLPRFHAVRIKSREQLIHVSRYIHLNPFSSGMVAKKREVLSYEYSSMSLYTESKKKSKDDLVDTHLILSEFDNDQNTYVDFVLSHAEEQRMREHIKHAEITDK